MVTRMYQCRLIKLAGSIVGFDPLLTVQRMQTLKNAIWSPASAPYRRNVNVKNGQQSEMRRLLLVRCSVLSSVSLSYEVNVIDLVRSDSSVD